jgi:hypothetical protein
MPGLFRLAVMQRIERPELDHLLFVRTLTHEVDGVDGIDFVGKRVASFGNDRVGHGLVAHANRLAALPEEIHDGRAEEPQVACRKRLQEARHMRVAAHVLEYDVKRKAAARTRGTQHGAEIEIDEIEFLGKAEVLGEQTIGGMRPCRIVDQAVRFVETRLRDRRGAHFLPASAAVRLYIRGECVDEEAIGECRDEGLLAMQMGPQARHFQRSQIELR